MEVTGNTRLFYEAVAPYVARVVVVLTVKGAHVRTSELRIRMSERLTVEGLMLETTQMEAVLDDQNLSNYDDR